MNNLSWFIYLAEVFDSLKVFSILISFTTFAILIVAGFVGAMFQAEGDDEDVNIGKSIHFYIVKKWWVPVVTALIGISLPSSDTMYAIAASEFGEELLKTETAGKVHQALDSWLDNQIDGVESE